MERLALDQRLDPLACEPTSRELAPDQRFEPRYRFLARLWRVAPLNVRLS